MSVNSFLGDSHDGQVDFHLGPIFTYQCCSQRTRVRRDSHFFKLECELVSLVLRLFKSWEKTMNLERLMTVFIFD